jgi:uncharacterized protein YkwD
MPARSYRRDCPAQCLPRAEKGLKPVRLDPALTAMAERQAQALAASGTISHDVASAFSSRLAASGINAAAGENLRTSAQAT